MGKSDTPSTGAMRTAVEAGRRRTLILFLICAGLAFLAHSGGLANGFITAYDDEEYVLSNGMVRQGLTLPGLWYALTGVCAANWHPLTMLSHMMDCTVFGLSPWGHHLTSLLLHALNAGMLFLALNRLTGSPIQSALAAALFAVHPIHVESVAHVSQRKDVLSTFFWVTSMWTYAAYVKRPGYTRYLATCGLMALGLLAKPTVVTLPFALLLLDIWPLKRVDLGTGTNSGATARTIAGLIAEKVPLFALTAVSSVVTFLVQRSAGAVMPVEAKPISVRAQNALVAYGEYLLKALWPTNLAAFYPYIEPLPMWRWLVALGVVALLSGTAIAFLRSRPYLAVGWFWFLGTLVPMIGMVQVGQQALADRYAYIPFFGLYIAAVWLCAEVVGRLRLPRSALAGVCCAVIAVLCGMTVMQTARWRNSVSIWRHTLRATGENVRARTSLGIALTEAGQFDEAVIHLKEAIRLEPESDRYVNLGSAYFRMQNVTEAEKAYRQALELAPTHAKALYNLGILCLSQKRFDEASALFEAIPGKTPSYYANVGDLYAEFGYLDQAEVLFAEALRQDPTNALVRVSQGRLRERRNDFRGAVELYVEAKRLDPRLPNIDVFIARARAAAQRRG
ncbi:MAG: hypothetical protein AMXMBFR4_05120 [Candidatus Hydrogenedentota bacterium]